MTLSGGTKPEWIQVGVSNLTGEPAEIISTERVEQMHLPEAFVKAMRSVITPGTTVLVTQASVDANSTGLQTTVMDAEEGSSAKNEGSRNGRLRRLRGTAKEPLRRCGAVAQMGERCNRTAEVRGSIPLSSTTGFSRKISRFSLHWCASGRATRCSGAGSVSTHVYYKKRGAAYRCVRPSM